MSDTWLLVHRDQVTGQWIGPRVVPFETAQAASTRYAQRGVRNLAVDLDDLERRLTGQVGS